MKPTFQKPTWANENWPERCEQASQRIELLVEPAYCGLKLSDIFRLNDRVMKDVALILLGNDFPSTVGLVSELVLIYSEKCECKECVFHQIEAV